MKRWAVTSQFWRFVVAGVANTLFGLTVYSACVLASLPVWGALIVGNLAGVGFNFVTTGGYVFRSLALSRLPRFVMAYFLIYVTNLALIRLISNWVASSIAAQAWLTIPMAVFSYVLMKRLVFHTAPTAPPHGGSGS